MPKPQNARQDLRIESLGKAHEKASFSCGVPALNRYLATQASQDVAKRVAACFVATPDGSIIAGFYTLSQYSIDLVELPHLIAAKLPKYPEVPATLLGRLAVNEVFRGQGVGEFLLLDALYRSLRQSKEIASAAVVVDAKDERAKGFYEHFEFLSLPGISHRLFLPMKAIEKLFSD